MTDTTTTDDAPATSWPTLPDGRMLVLRTCNPDLTSHYDGRFQWPDVGGTVEAPDWDPNPERDCGGGLHGLLWGCGNAQFLSEGHAYKWLVVAVDPVDIADPDAPGKIRFRAAEVVLVTEDRSEAVAYLDANGAALLPTVFGTATAGYSGTATAGYSGTATAGLEGILAVGWWDGEAERRRITIGYVGEDGIEAGITYRCDPQGRLVAAAS